MAAPSSQAGSTVENEWLFEKRFTFIIGPGEKKAYLRPKVITQEFSRPLHTLIKGPFKEAEAGEATLPDCDVSTFTYFASYLFTRTYSLPNKSQTHQLAPEHAKHAILRLGLVRFHCRWCKAEVQIFEDPEIVKAAEILEDLEIVEAAEIFEVPEISEDADDLFPFCSTGCSALGRYSHHVGYCTGCGLFSSTRALPYSDGVSTMCGKCTASLQKVSTVNFKLSTSYLVDLPMKWSLPQPGHLLHEYEASDDLVEHAKLAVFADKWDVQGLEKLAIQNLYKDLATYAPTSENISQLLDLIAYTWENTRDDTGNDDERSARVLTLRGLIVAYVEDTAAELSKIAGFADFLREHGEFAQPVFMRLVAKRPRRDRHS